MGGDIPALFCEPPTDQLGHLSSNSRVHTQQLEEWNDEEHPFFPSDGVSPSCWWTLCRQYIPIGWAASWPSSTDKMRCSNPHDQGTTALGKTPWYAQVQSGWPSMARQEESQDGTTNQQVSPSMPWTLPYHSGDVACFLSAPTPASVAHSPHVPHRPADSLSWNYDAQGQLPMPPTRAHQ